MSKSGDKTRSLTRRIWVAQLVIGFERFWQAAFWPVMIVGVILLGIFSGFFEMLSAPIRMGVLGAGGLAFLYSLKSFSSVRLPDRDAAIKRIEEKSALRHNPLQTLHDQPGGNGGDARTARLWAAHKERQLEKLGDLKTGTPQSGWMYRDTRAWRFTLATLLLLALFFNGADWRSKVANAVALKNPVATTPVHVDAWISPPVFTRKPPVLLTGVTARAKADAGGEIIVPEGSKLHVRVNGVETFTLALLDSNGKVLDRFAAKATGKKDATDKAPRFAERTLVLKRPVAVVLSYDGREQRRWDIVLIPDASPTIAISGKIKVTATGAFSIPWVASDDYGLAGVSGKLTLVDTDKKTPKGKGPLRYDVPAISISLPRLHAKKAKGKAFQDFTAHPLAGQKVSLVLTVRDQAGQTGRSKPVTFTLPQRRFNKPLAQVLVEQRAKLVATPHKKKDILSVFAALMSWPKGLVDKSAHYVGLRLAARKLHRAGDRKSLKGSVKDLWDLAIAIEDGNLSAARRDLEAIRRALQQALRDGASPERIAELTRQLRKALNNYMQALTREAQRNAARNQQGPNGLQQPGREIRQQDLKRMMDNIERLAKSGARDAAQQMLSQLENILRNLNPSLTRRQMAPQRTPPEARALQELTDLLRRQRELMDKTFKMPRDGNRMDLEQGNRRQRQNNQQGQRRPNNQNGNLTRQQEQLGQALQRLIDRMRKGGRPNQPGLNQARRAMRDAARNLRNGRRGRALRRQGQAMQGLRRGAQQMARDLMQRGNGDNGNFGRHSENGPERDDPLGRPMPRRGTEFGPEKNMIPKQSEIMRAQDIMRILRERSNDRTRPKLELDYLDRLLKGLY